jgi:hypothetical protein
MLCANGLAAQFTHGQSNPTYLVQAKLPPGRPVSASQPLTSHPRSSHQLHNNSLDRAGCVPHSRRRGGACYARSLRGTCSAPRMRSSASASSTPCASSFPCRLCEWEGVRGRLAPEASSFRRGGACEQAQGTVRTGEGDGQQWRPNSRPQGGQPLHGPRRRRYASHRRPTPWSEPRAQASQGLGEMLVKST